MTERALQRELRLSWRKIVSLADLADDRYHEAELPKLGGDPRPLLIPRGRLKQVQTILRRKVFATIPPHAASFCVRGRGAVAAAELHAWREYFLHADIKKFYPSVTPQHVTEALVRLKMDRPVAEIVTRLVTTRGMLPQGATTSPALGELVLFPLDHRISGLARGSITYTRYADDIAISGGKKRMLWVQRRVVEIVEDFGWQLNSKGGLFGPDKQHIMLGIVVNGSPNVSRRYVDDVRRMLRLAATGTVKLAEGQVRSLRGKLEWIATVNPRRAASLRPLFEEAVRRSSSLTAAD